jgi:DNA invertase Pin-like site-specific DNA recombinase
MKIGYSRCSAVGQNHQSQIDALEIAGCERIFQETASGSRNDREELTKLIEFARAGDAVVVVRLDRLGRNIRHTLDVVDQLTRKGIALVSLGEHIDGTTPSGRLAVHMLAALSQYELEQKRLACEAGRKAAIARGRVGGRPRSLDETKLKVVRALATISAVSSFRLSATSVSVGSVTLEQDSRSAGRSGSAAFPACHALQNAYPSARECDLPG